MLLLIIIAAVFLIYKVTTSASDRASARRAEAERQRIMQEQAAQREAFLRQQEVVREAWRRQQEAEKARIAWQKEQERINREAAQERERLAKEQERQAAKLREHEEMLVNLDNRLAFCESEIAFNREQRDRLFKLLDLEELERDAAIPNSQTWQKHQRKVIALENQIHTAQRRIDKAQADKRMIQLKLA